MLTQEEPFELWLEYVDKTDGKQSPLVVPESFARLPCGDELPVAGRNPDGSVQLRGQFRLVRIAKGTYVHEGCTSEATALFQVWVKDRTALAKEYSPEVVEYALKVLRHWLGTYKNLRRRKKRGSALGGREASLRNLSVCLQRIRISPHHWYNKPPLG